MTIKAILFDMGGTLRKNTKRDDPTKTTIVQQIIDLLGSDSSAAELTNLLTVREKAYEEWASKNLLELDETGFWTQWMLPDWPDELISRHAMKLNEIWRDAICTRKLFPETCTTIRSLSQRGYRLGLVSNTTSSVDTPKSLEKSGIAGFFDVIILSCKLGKRKPAPDILLEASKRMGVLPKYCAYIGDRPDWDVAAAHAAGFGMAVIVHTIENRSYDQEYIPDCYLTNLTELLEIFPGIERNNV